MDKILKLYTYVDGGTNDTPFPDADNPIEIGAFRYDAKRMGGAPTITASVYYPSCLDGEWTDRVYAKFNDEKYFLKQTPTSSYSNEDSRYKHELTLVSERAILDNVLFYDAVIGEPQGEDKPVSNSTKFVFFGTIDEFANRLNDSLQYAKLQKVDSEGKYASGYRVIVDEGVTSEALLVSFEDQYFSNAIQESYNTYKVPYYFVDKEIHFGDSKNVVEHEFAYGVDNALLSITKNNANNKIVNRVTGKGSSENLPYYYPNRSPKGNIYAETNNNFSVEIFDYELYSNRMHLNGVITKSNVGYKNLVSSRDGEEIYSGEEFQTKYANGARSESIIFSLESEGVGNLNLTFKPTATGIKKIGLEAVNGRYANIRWSVILVKGDANAEHPHASDILFREEFGAHAGEATVSIPIEKAKEKYHVVVTVQLVPTGEYQNTDVAVIYTATYSLGSSTSWVDESGKSIDPISLGLLVDDRAQEGDTITQRLAEYITPSTELLPPIYRNSFGEERFYNAINGKYKDENEQDIIFNHPYVEGQPKEHIISIDDIKPTIKGATVLQPNGSSGAGYTLPIDMFTAFAYDADDNDETYEGENGEVFFKHPYFFGKLRVLDFNIFESANENQPMTISFTSGNCGACNFEIGVTEDFPPKNPVQVTGEGELVYKDGRVLCGIEGIEGQAVTEYQKKQQDTSKYEVWVALKKEEATYGTLMPSAPAIDEHGNKIGGHRPKACTSPTSKDGDTFVILGINLKQAYIDRAERDLEAEIIKYMKDNNDEKFNFGITLSRIFFAENPTILEQLTENASLNVWYNGVRYPLFVSSISYNMEEDDILPEVRVELVDSLSVSQNAIQAAVSQVKADMSNALANIDFLGASTPYFLRKDTDDEVRSIVDFKKGIKFGEGGKVEIMDNNSAKLTIEYLEVTKKATFTSLEIQEKTHVGGQMLVTPASMSCGEVEELEDSYRCYFQTKGLEGNEEIFNQFVVGDQAICQTFNAWGSKYYWRLVTGVGEDYIDLSKTDCDEGSGVPEAGDRIIQMGNRDNEDRQNAIVIAAHGDNSPYIVQYKGISNFDLPNNEDDERITTLLSPTKNILTGQVIMQAGSKGLESFAEWAEKQKLIDSKASAEELEAYAPIKEAIENNFTVIDGGLIQSALLMLGYQDEDGVYHIMSGTNGVYNEQDANGGIAAWYGGEMSEEGENRAKAVIRFDGSGYFANKNLTWNSEGEAEFAGGLIKITKDGALVLGDNVQFGVETKATVGDISYDVDELRSMFSFEDGELCTIHPLLIKNNLFVEGDTATGGEGQNTTPSINLDNLDDVTLGGLRIGDLLLFNGSQWVNAPQSEIVPNVDLTGYATENYVNSEIAKITPASLGVYTTSEVDAKVNALGIPSLKEKVEGIESTLGDDVSGKINTWNEIVNFLDEYNGSEDLATILSKMQGDINSRALGSDLNETIARVEDNEGAIEDLQGNKADKATTLAGYGITNAYTKEQTYDREHIDSEFEDVENALAVRALKSEVYTKEDIDGKLTGITTDIDNLESSKASKDAVNAIDDRLKIEEDVTKTYAAWWKDLMTYVKVENGNVVIDTNLLVEGESATRGTGDPSTGGVIDEKKLAEYLEEKKYINEGALLKYGFATEGYVNDAISALNIGNYAKTSEVERLFTALNIGQYAKTTEVNTALSGKVDKVSGKGLSTNDFTTALLNKLNAIAEGAEVNVQSDWNATSGDAFIKNKPTLGALAFVDSLLTSDVSEGTNKYFTDARAIAAVLGSSAIGSTSAYPYWDGSAWKTKTLGNLAYVNSLSKSDVGLGNVANETYAGGTAVTLNGFSKAKSTASFYAPTSAGTVGYFLKSQGVGDAPIWAALGKLATMDSLTYSDVGVTKSVITSLIGTTTYAAYNANGYLPLSGGTIESDSHVPLSLNTTNSQCRIQFKINGSDKALVGWAPTYGSWLYNYASAAYLGIKDDGTPHYNGNTLIHNGNIGSQSVASLIQDKVTDLNSVKVGTFFQSSLNATNLPSGASSYLTGFSLATNNNPIYRVMLGIDLGGNIFARAEHGGNWKDWHQIAFTDSDFKLGLGHSITDSNDRSALSISADNQINIGYGTAGANFNTNIHGASIILKYGTSRSWGMVMNTSGNVTIGNTDKASTSTTTKLYVDGGIRFAPRTIWGQSFDGSGDISGSLKLFTAIAGGWARYINVRKSDDSVLSSFGFYGAGDSLIYLYLGGTYSLPHMLINSSGNVTIGASDLAGTDYALNVGNLVSIGKHTNPSPHLKIIAVGSNVNYIHMYVDSNNATTGRALVLQNGYGNVGIGCEPQYKLDVNGVINTNNSIYLNTTLIGRGTYAGASLYFGGRDGEALSIEIIDEKVQWLRDGMKLMKNGNVLIGATTDSGYKLNVSGRINATTGVRIGGASHTSGLYPESSIGGGTGDNNDLWLYTTKGLYIYGSSINLKNAVTMSSTLSVASNSYYNGNAFFNAGKEGIYISSSGDAIAWHNASNAYTNLLMNFTATSLVVTPNTTFNKAVTIESTLTVGGKVNTTGNIYIGTEVASYTTQNYLYFWKGDGTYRHRGLMGVNENGAFWNYYNPTLGTYKELTIGPNGLTYANSNSSTKAFSIDTSGNTTINGKTTINNDLIVTGDVAVV